MTTPDFMGDALRRQSKQQKEYKAIGVSATSLDGIQVTTSDSRALNTYQTTNLNGDEYDRMRRYGLVLAKWSLPNPKRNVARWNSGRSAANLLPLEAAIAASRITANEMYKQTFGEDPTTNTVLTAPLIGALSVRGATISKELAITVAALAGTNAYKEIIANVPKKIAEVLTNAQHAYDAVVQTFLDEVNGLYGNKYERERAIDSYYKTLTRTINGEAEALTSRSAPKPTKASKKRRNLEESMVHAKPIMTEHTSGWAIPYLRKHELDLPHTGKAGRRDIPTNEGKYPKHFYRLVTDPYRRIFTRRTRALGGVVVFDCSGSMSLTEEDIRRVMNAAAGCSIVCYSSGNELHDAKYGNIHLVARNGRQARHLPIFPGNNGVDLPAIKWAYNNLRLNSKSPVIWVSDGQVTGDDYTQSHTLERETQAYCKSKGVIQVETVSSAIHLLHNLQRSIRK